MEFGEWSCLNRHCFAKENVPWDGDVQPVLEMLYDCYLEQNSFETQQIKEDFHSLDRILSKLSLQEYDQVWNLTCRLCSEHEKSAFLEGIRTAMRLTVELDDDPMLTGKAQ